MLDRPRRWLLSRWAGLICDHPLWVVLTAGAVAAGAIALTSARLTFQSDRNDLLSPQLDWNHRYIEYRDSFVGHDVIVIAAEVPDDPEGRREVRRFIRTAASLIDPQQESGVRRVWWGYDPADASPALIRLLPMEQLQARLDQMAAAEPLLRAAGVGDMIDAVTAQLVNAQSQLSEDEALERINLLGRLIDALRRGLTGELDPQTLQSLTALDAESWQYLSSEDGQLLFVEIEGQRVEGELDPLAPAVNAARRALDRAREQFPGVRAGLTGIPVVEADETQVSMRDSTLCSILAVIAIAVLLIVAFHGWQFPLLMVTALMIGVGWSFCFLTLAVGHLQVLSVVFTVILLGLGIDFGIHLVSHFELVRHRHPEGVGGFRSTMTDTLRTTGPGIMTGAVTTAIAFATTLLTDFSGMAEMGLIAGVGVLLCLLAMLTVLPALMRLLRPRVQHITPSHLRGLDMHNRDWLLPLLRHPVLTVAIAAVLIAASAQAMRRVPFDYNLLNLLPTGFESVGWQNRILDSETAIWYGVSIAESLEEAERHTQQFRDLPSVESIGGIGLLFPPSEPEKIERIERTRAALADALGDAASPDPEPDTAASLRQRLNNLRFALNLGLQRPELEDQPRIREALRDVLERIDAALAVMQRPEFTDHSPRRLTELHRAFADLRAGLRRRIDAALTARPLRPDDLPGFLRRQALSVTNPTRYQIKIYPGQNVWDPARMEPFIRDIRSIDPRVTGSPVQIYESGLLMRHSYQFAGMLALMVVFVLAYLDFLRLADALLCLLPVGSALVVTFGFMWLFGVPLNLANIMGLPLLFGIGVASGVHVMHRYKQAPRRRPPGLTAGTGKGVILTSATTIIAFATMMLATHRGIRSLGFMLAVGISLTLLACLTLMPAVLELRNRWHVLRRIAQWRRIERREQRRPRQKEPTPPQNR